MTTAARHSSTARAAFLSLLRHGEQALRDDFAAFADRARGVLLQAADETGRVPPGKQSDILHTLAAALVLYFVAQDGHGYLTTRGIVLPKSPYVRLLWGQIEQATHDGVQVQSDLLRTSLRDEQTLIRQLQTASVNPFLAYDLLMDEDADFFRTYVPPQDYPRGDRRVLDDRILNAAASTREKVGALVRDQFSQGKTAQAVADALRDYLNSKGLYDASRLLGSETAFAYNRASHAAALLNPFIEQVDVVLSPSHPHEDECDGFAGGSPYALKEAPIPPFHSNCLCGWRYHVNGQTRAVIERLRGSNVLRIKGALSPDFADLLLRGNPAP